MRIPASFLVLATATFATARLAKRAPLKPSVDPFYVAPAGWEDASPGAVLRSRQIKPAFLNVIPLPLTSWQLLYRTTDGDEKPAVTVTTIYVPFAAKPDSLVLYATPEDSTTTNCAPSCNTLLGANVKDLVLTFPFPVDQVFMSPLLAKGLIVTIPDHEGPTSAYGNGRFEGRMTLDAIRATLAFGSTIGLNAGANSVLWEYSGGAIAVGWAAALAASYAPELNLVGAAHGGTPADLKALALNLNGGVGSGLLLGALVGITQSNKAFKESFESVATPKMMTVVKTAGDQCLASPSATLVDFLTTEYLTTGLATLDLPVWKATLENLKLGASPSLVPKIPLHIVHAKGDELIPWAVAAAMVSSYCAEDDASLGFITNDTLGVEHIVMDLISAPGAIKFLTDRLDGVPFAKGCVYKSGS